MFEISRSFTFEAAHAVATGGVRPHYEQIHGHSFKARVTLCGEPDAAHGWVCDLAKLAEALTSIANKLDHKLLNEIEGLEKPTLEHLCRWIHDQLHDEFPQISAVEVSRPSLDECCILRL